MPPARALRETVAGHTALRLGSFNSADITLLSQSFEGGNVYSDVIPDESTGLSFTKKHIGQPKYEAFSVLIGMSMSDELFDWIAGSWGAQPAKKNGAVLSLDYELDVLQETQFSGALITETSIPVLDAASKEAGRITLKFQTETIDTQPGSGKLSLIASKQKLWCASNFRLEIDGLDCTRVSKIDGFTVKQLVKMASSGSGGVTLVPGKIEFPDLHVTLSQLGASTWLSWHKSFVVDGNNGETFERNGVLRFLAADLATELSRIELHRLGIARLAPILAKGNQIPRLAATLYCEEMALSRPGGSP